MWWSPSTKSTMRFHILPFVRSVILVLLGLICVYALVTSRLNYTKNRIQERQAMLKKIRAQMVSVKEQNVPIGQQVCQHPRLGVRNWRRKMNEDFLRINCAPDADWVVVNGDVATIEESATNSHGPIVCWFTSILRGKGDARTREGETKFVTKEFIFTESDFAKVRCKSSKGDTWSSVLAAVRPDSKLRYQTGWGSLSATTLPLNVLILGFHSLSRIMFMNTMPNTYAYLLDTLGGEMMEGFNAVGEGKRSALIPLLTGHDELELPDLERTGGEDAVNLDDYPFIWKEFRRAGYVTGFVEDTANLSIVSQGMNGFMEQPTDFFMRPFFLEASKHYSDHEDFCLGSTPRFKAVLRYVTNVYERYRDRPKFLFGFFEELNSNHTFHMMGHSDVAMRDWLKTMKEAGLLDDTLLVVFSDHEQNIPEHLVTLQARLEERLPFLSLVFPSWFKIGHQREMRNLRTNAHRLTTPYDLHATLAAILDNTGDDKGALTERGISLLREVPLERTCEHAFIPARWCACLSWSHTALSEYIVEHAADKVIEVINSDILEDKLSCLTLSIKHVVWSRLLSPNEELLKTSTHKMAIMEVFCRLRIATDPGGLLFDAVVKYDIARDEMSLRVADIEWVNELEPGSGCETSGPEMWKRFCVCRAYLHMKQVESQNQILTNNNMSVDFEN